MGPARPGDFQAGYQQIGGINLGYLQINGTQMFALAQVLSGLFKDIPRATISRRMDSLKIKNRRCDLRELRTLKAIRSVPTRAVKCSLISRADLEALCTSCQGLGPGGRERERKRKRREPGGLFQCPGQQLLAPCRAGAYCTQDAGICSKRPPAPGPPPARLLGGPFSRGFRSYDKAPRGRRGEVLGGRRGLLAGVVTSYPPDLQLRRCGAHGAGPAPPASQAGCAPGLFPAEKRPGSARQSRLFPGCKRQGTSAGYSSDSDSSLDAEGCSAPTSSDSSEEEEGATSCSSEEGTSSESESSSLCSRDSVQSTRYRQAALPRYQPLLPPPHPAKEPGGEERLPEPPKAALRPGPDLLLLSQQLWARTLRASAWESLRPLPALGAGAPQPELAGPKPGAPAPPRGSPPGGDSQKRGGCGEAEPGAEGEGLRSPAVNNAGPSEPAPGLLAGSAPAPPARDSAGSPSPAPQTVLAEPRREHFDRLIRRAKLWCYAKGFSVDGKSLRPGGRPEPGGAAEFLSPGSRAAPSPLASKAGKGPGSERHPKRRRLPRGAEAERAQRSSKGGPQKTPRRGAPKRKAPDKRPASAGPPPARNSFSLMGSFPCTPSLVVGADGDLCPAASLCVKSSGALSKTHPLWRWQLGGSALPVPPSLRFRGYGREGR
ncbi:elongin BC and Polycomb repressive complex 2-associated protein [Carettochelys insculpta]|uniref:elongin BC and Polycomb repressive complex 2-associated protein n=1 Tax=Carettochelys insculpta TaxID=44489 RepID=UPI003EBA1EE4